LAAWCAQAAICPAIRSARLRTSTRACFDLRAWERVLRPPSSRLTALDFQRYILPDYGKAESVETTQICLHADLRQKEEALAKVTASDLPPGRFRPDDELLPILEGL
jgi:hypothetical protein